MSAATASPSSASRHLVDPELLPALDAMPAFAVSTGSLEQIRRAVAGMSVPAPPAPDTTMEERWVARPDGTRLRLLVFRPKAASCTGGLLWLHGGGMVMAKPDGNEPLCRYLAQAAGCVVVAPDYRLAPEYPYPAGLQDCYAALGWMHAAAGEIGMSVDRIAVAGESGGGCLAAGLSLLARGERGAALTAQFLLYPMLDDRTGTAADPDPLPHTGEFVWTRESNRFAWGAVLGREPGGAHAPAQAAPARADDLSGTPPTFMAVGDLDLFLGETLRYSQTLARSAVPVDLHVYPGAYHGFISFAQDAAVSKKAFRAFVDAISSHFGNKAHATTIAAHETRTDAVVA